MSEIIALNHNHGEKVKKPLITLAVITYNAGRTIEDCLESVFALDYPKEKYEVIVVDNCSTDKTLEVVSKFPVNRTIKLHKRETRGIARNVCVSEAKGEIVVMHDADEILPSNYLKRLIKCFDDPKVAWTWGPVKYMNKSSDEMGFMQRVIFVYMTEEKEFYGKRGL